MIRSKRSFPALGLIIYLVFMNRLEGMLAGSSGVQNISPELAPSLPDDDIIDTNVDDCQRQIGSPSARLGLWLKAVLGNLGSTCLRARHPPPSLYLLLPFFPDYARLQAVRDE